MTLDDFPFVHRLGVRPTQIDECGWVLPLHQRMLLDSAMTECWRAMALSHEALRQLGLGQLVLQRSSVVQHAPARRDDALQVALRCERVEAASITFRAGLFRDGTLLTEAEQVHGLVDPAANTPQALPLPLILLLRAFQQGQAMTQLATGDWVTLGEAASVVRTAVFVQEQGIARADEWDAADQTAVHAVVTNRLGLPVATGRLLREGAPDSGVARIGRMAVQRALRGLGLGRQVVDALQAVAWARGDRRVVLSAQQSALDFYRRLGYQSDGQPYEEVGIVHVDMQRELA